jgi:hypothetical protein
VSAALLESLLREVAHATLAGTLFCVKVGVILVPAMVLAPLPVFGRIGRAVAPHLARFGMSPVCTVPLAAGLFLGIIYGAGIIVPIAGERRIRTSEIQSIGLFLCSCHAVVEDTLLLTLIGVRGAGEVATRVALLLGARFVLAVGVTAARARWLRARREPTGDG